MAVGRASYRNISVVGRETRYSGQQLGKHCNHVLKSKTKVNIFGGPTFDLLHHHYYSPTDVLFRPLCSINCNCYLLLTWIRNFFLYFMCLNAAPSSFIPEIYNSDANLSFRPFKQINKNCQVFSQKPTERQKILWNMDVIWTSQVRKWAQHERRTCTCTKQPLKSA
jgi:hypothetical protein